MIKTEEKGDNFLSLLEKKNLFRAKKCLFFTFSPLEKTFLQKKMFKVTKKKYKKNNRISDIYNTYGIWNKSEHNKFIEALYQYNCAWRKIESYLKNRTYKQIRSHVQKFNLRLKSFKDEELGLDFTSPHVNNLKDIIKIIREKESINQNGGKLLYIISEKISLGKNIEKEKINKKFIEKKRKAQLNNFKYKNININNRNIKEKCNNISHIDFEDLFIDTNENKNQIQNQSLNYLEYNNFLFNDVGKDFDNALAVNNDIRDDPNILLTILS